MNSYFYEFMAQIIVGEIIFSTGFPRRDHFLLRLGISLAAVALVVTGMTFTQLIVDFSRWYVIYLVIMMLLSVGVIVVCYDVKIFSVLYMFAGGYAGQHMSYCLFKILYYYFGFAIKNRIEWYLLDYGCIVSVYIVLYFAFVHNSPKNIIKKRDNRAFAVALIAFAINLILSEIVTRNGSDSPFISDVICKIYGFTCCLLILFLEKILFRENKLEYEKEVVSYLYKEKEAQQLLAEENIQNINVKLHDIKHQLNALKSMDPESEERKKYVADLEKSVAIYDCRAHTGNKDLDVILTEKGLYCLKNAIRFSVMAGDGAAIDFMDSLDVYALFSNAIDNAIHSVEHEEPKNRFIDLKISRENNVIKVCLYNYCNKKVRFDGRNLPITTQADKNIHGFGVISMSEIVKKYNGIIIFKQEDDLFYTGILFFRK